MNLNKENSILMHVESSVLSLEFQLIVKKENDALVIRAQYRSVTDFEFHNYADDWGHEFAPTKSLQAALEQFSDMMKRSLDFYLSEGRFEDGDELTVDADENQTL